MELSNFIQTVLAGIVGTIGMTLVMYGYAIISRKNTKVIHILGTMVIGNASRPDIDSWKANLAGTLGHFGVGIIFSWSYFLLWNWGIFNMTLGDSIFIGLVSGILAIFVWLGYFQLHSNPPKVDLLHYSVALMIAHIVFGIFTVYMCSLLVEESEFWFELRQRINAMI